MVLKPKTTGIRETMVGRILMFMWSLGPLGQSTPQHDGRVVMGKQDCPLQGRVTYAQNGCESKPWLCGSLTLQLTPETSRMQAESADSIHMCSEIALNIFDYSSHFYYIVRHMRMNRNL